MKNLKPFHLAIEVDNLEEARIFYREVLGCEEGRSSADWIDFNFFGHQLVCHKSNSTEKRKSFSNDVDEHQIPVPHFGIVLEIPQWHEFSEKLREAGIEFVIEPYVRFEGTIGEQGTFFLRDPAGNAIEVKGFNDIEAELFKKS